jgi:hypothetical protein
VLIQNVASTAADAAYPNSSTHTVMCRPLFGETPSAKILAALPIDLLQDFVQP